MLLFFLTSLFLALLFFALTKMRLRQKKMDCLPFQIAHELRSPLTILQGYAETITLLPHLSPSQIQEIGRKMLLASQRIDRIVAAFMTLSEVEKEQCPAVACDLWRCLERCKEHILERYSKRVLLLPQKKENLWIGMKESFLEIVLMNLLENAARYSLEDTPIRITWEEKKGGLLLSIEDQGAGIDPQHLPHIFKSFYCADREESRKHGGAGLGLFIVKRILDQANGKIFVRSKKGEGTIFSLFAAATIDSNL